MAWKPNPDLEVPLFRDMTSPVGGPLVGFADDPLAEGDEAPEGGSPEQTIHVHHPGGQQEDVPASAIHTFTVGKQAALSSTEVHRFKQHNALLTRSLAARLSLFLRTELVLEQVSLEVIDLVKYQKLFPGERHIILFKIQPFEAVGAMDVAKPLGLTIADRMLGGKGFAVNPDRTIREVETAMINQIAQIYLREWANYWKFEEPLRVSLLGTEHDPSHIPSSGSDEQFYHMCIDAEIGDCMDQIQILLPVRGLEPLLRQIAQHTRSGTEEEEEEEHWHEQRQHWNNAYDKVRVPLVAQWSDLRILARDLLHLKKGDIIPLDPKRLNQVEVLLAGQIKFIGRLGNLENKVAVQLKERFKP
jgi:flagellar motor switch protein FliM